MSEDRRSQWQRMIEGDLYDPQDPELVSLRQRARAILRQYNGSGEGEERRRLLEELLGHDAPGLWIEPPFYCDYGRNIRLGRNVYFNFDCIVLDVAPVIIGDNVMFGPAVQIYTATHPLDAAERRSGRELGRAIEIGPDVWVGGAAVINPGVTIGAETVVGAGSVVTRDLPARVFAAGNPCRVIREIGSTPRQQPATD